MSIFSKKKTTEDLIKELEKDKQKLEYLLDHINLLKNAHNIALNKTHIKEQRFLIMNQLQGLVHEMSEELEKINKNLPKKIDFGNVKEYEEEISKFNEDYNKLINYIKTENEYHKKILEKINKEESFEDKEKNLEIELEKGLKVDDKIIEGLQKSIKNVDEILEKISKKINTYIKKYPTLLNIEIKSEKDLDNLFCRVAYAFGMENNVKIYLVGGYVRDKITGFESKDLDCNVSQKNDEFAKLFCEIAQELFGFQFSANQQSSTGNWKINCGDVKKDGYDVNKYEGDITEALSKPDFTINGIAIDITPKISQSEFHNYSISLIYDSKLPSKNFKFLIYPDKLFLEDAINKIFRIPESTKKSRDPKLGPRLLKFYERFFPSFEAQGFKLDKESLNFLIVNSGYLRIAKNGYLFRLQRKNELKKLIDNPESINVLNAIEQFRKESNNRTLKEFLVFCKDNIQKYNEKVCTKIYEFSFFPIREAIEEFIFSENQNKSYENFMKILKSKGIDINYFGHENVKNLWENRKTDSFLIYSDMVSRDYGQSLGFVIKTLKGTAKWLKNYNGDEDLRIYNCFKSIQNEGNVINSLIEEFNLENLRFLKVSGISNEYVRTDIRIAALLADLKFNINTNKIGDEKIDIPDSLNKVFSKMSQSSTFTKQNQFFISVLLNVKELLLALRFFRGSEKHMIINSVKIKNMLKYMNKKNLIFMSEDKLIRILLNHSLNIINACSSLKGTKYFNPKFDVNINEIQAIISKLDSIISDEKLINFYSKPIIEDGKKLMTIGFRGSQIRVARGKQIEAQYEGKIKTEEEAEQFLRDLIAA